jgi:hypothetical protein
LPSFASVPTVSDLEAMRQQVLSLSKTGKKTAATAEYLGDDWTTGGDWPGRYGSCEVFRAGGNNRKSTVSTDYDGAVFTGPYIRNAQVDSAGMDGDVPVDANWLFAGRGTRALGWVEDGTTGNPNYPPTMQGPDLYVGVRVPDGSHAISLYFYTGHNPRDPVAARQRDYVLTVRRGDDLDPKAKWNNNSSQDLSSIEVAPVLATARASGFADCGVYERFAVHGRGIWWVKIGRNYSDSTRLQAVFVDKLGGSAPAGKWPGLQAAPPMIAMPADAATPSNPAADSAYALWTALDSAEASPGYADIAPTFRAAAYRAAAAARVSADWPANWRAVIGAYSDEDKAAYRKSLGLPTPPNRPQP